MKKKIFLLSRVCTALVAVICFLGQAKAQFEVLEIKQTTAMQELEKDKANMDIVQDQEDCQVKRDPIVSGAIEIRNSAGKIFISSCEPQVYLEEKNSSACEESDYRESTDLGFAGEVLTNIASFQTTKCDAVEQLSCSSIAEITQSQFQQIDRLYRNQEGQDLIHLGTVLGLETLFLGGLNVVVKSLKALKAAEKAKDFYKFDLLGGAAERTAQKAFLSVAVAQVFIAPFAFGPGAERLHNVKQGRIIFSDNQRKNLRINYIGKRSWVNKSTIGFVNSLNEALDYLKVETSLDEGMRLAP